MACWLQIKQGLPFAVSAAQVKHVQVILCPALPFGSPVLTPVWHWWRLSQVLPGQHAPQPMISGMSQVHVWSHMSMVYIYKGVHVPYHPSTHPHLSPVTKLGQSCSLWSHDRNQQINGSVPWTLLVSKFNVQNLGREGQVTWNEFICTHLCHRCCLGGVTVVVIGRVSFSLTSQFMT